MWFALGKLSRFPQPEQGTKFTRGCTWGRRTEILGWAAGESWNGIHIGRHRCRDDPRSDGLGRKERDWVVARTSPRGRLNPAAAAAQVPVPSEARSRPSVPGAALALPRSPFSLVFAIKPNLLRQEVQMSPNCFHSDAVFSSEAVV